MSTTITPKGKAFRMEKAKRILNPKCRPEGDKLFRCHLVSNIGIVWAYVDGSNHLWFEEFRFQTETTTFYRYTPRSVKPFHVDYKEGNGVLLDGAIIDDSIILADVRFQFAHYNDYAEELLSTPFILCATDEFEMMKRELQICLRGVRM